MGKAYSTRPPPSPKGGRFAKPKAKSPEKLAKLTHDDFTSDGVEDNDVFLLPVSDYQVMLLVTIVGAIVRLFRIYQPTSVVFDEVQYVSALLRTNLGERKKTTNMASSSIASVASLRNTSRANSSWMSILLWPKC